MVASKVLMATKPLSSKEPPDGRNSWYIFLKEYRKRPKLIARSTIGALSSDTMLWLWRTTKLEVEIV